MPSCTATESSHLLVPEKADPPTASPAKLALLRAINCQPTTDVSPGSLGLYAPAAVGRVLGIEDEVHRPLRRPANFLVTGQPVGLAKGDCGQAVRVHHLRRALGQVAIGLLVQDQPGEAFADMFLVGAFGLVRLSGGQEGQEAHGRCPGIGGNLARAGAGLVGAALRVVLQAPTAVGQLVIGQPDEGGIHGAFATFGDDDLLAAAMRPVKVPSPTPGPLPGPMSMFPRPVTLGPRPNGSTPPPKPASFTPSRAAAACGLGARYSTVVFRGLSVRGGRFRRGGDIQYLRLGFVGWADFERVDSLGWLLLRLFLGMRDENSRVVLILAAAEIRQQQQSRQREKMKAETAGVPDQLGPHPVDESFHQGFLRELTFVGDRQRVFRSSCHERSPFN